MKLVKLAILIQVTVLLVTVLIITIIQILAA